MTTLYLASGSPRRQELLTQLGLSFERLVPGIEERRGRRRALRITLRVWRESAGWRGDGAARSAGVGGGYDCHS